MKLRALLIVGFAWNAGAASLPLEMRMDRLVQSMRVTLDGAEFSASNEIPWLFEASGSLDTESGIFTLENQSFTRPTGTLSILCPASLSVGGELEVQWDWAPGEGDLFLPATLSLGSRASVGGIGTIRWRGYIDGTPSPFSDNYASFPLIATFSVWCRGNCGLSLGLQTLSPWGIGDPQPIGPMIAFEGPATIYGSVLGIEAPEGSTFLNLLTLLAFLASLRHLGIESKK